MGALTGIAIQPPSTAPGISFPGAAEGEAAIQPEIGVGRNSSAGIDSAADEQGCGPWFVRTIAPARHKRVVAAPSRKSRWSRTFRGGAA